MSDLSPNNRSSNNNHAIYREDSAKTHALIAYALMAIGLFTGIFWIAGAVWAMLKKSDAQGTVFVDHYSNMISTFWWCLILSIIGWVLMIVGVGWILLGFVWLYGIYKIVKGLVKITSNKPYHS